MHTKDKNRNALKHDGVEPIRLHDDHGRLIAAGVEWIELRKVVGFLIACALFPFLFFTCYVLIVTVLTVFALKPLLLLLLCSWLAMVVWPRAIYFSLRRRAVVFHVDGKLACPLGQVMLLHVIPPPEEHTDIVSIETKHEGENLYTVEVFLGEGDVRPIGHHMPELIARKCVAQLTKALREIREAMGEDLRRAGGQKHRELEVID